MVDASRPGRRVVETVAARRTSASQPLRRPPPPRAWKDSGTIVPGLVDEGRLAGALGDVQQRLLLVVVALDRGHQAKRQPRIGAQVDAGRGRAARRGLGAGEGQVVARPDLPDGQNRGARLLGDGGGGGQRSGQQAGERAERGDSAEAEHRRIVMTLTAEPACHPVPRARAPFRQVHVPQGRSRLAPARGASARPGQDRVRDRLRRLRRRPPAARLFAGRHTRGCRPDAARAGPEPGAHPRVPRRAGPERADEVVLDPPLLPGHDQGVGVLGRVAPGGASRPRHVPVRVSRS